MASSHPRTLRLVLLASIALIGIPNLFTPYNSNLQAAVFYGLGLAVVGIAALALRAYDAAPFWKTAIVMALALPATAMLRVIVDTARDPTSHNLWPLELMLAAFYGAFCAILGAAIGQLLRRYLAKGA